MSPGACRALLLCSVATILVSHAAHAQGVPFGQNFRIELTAAPQRLPADGQSVARIQATVRTRDNQPAPDGTEVIFHTSVGHVSTTGVTGRTDSVSAQTQGGYAIVELTSEEPGTATVRASAGNAWTEVLVDFGGEAEESPVVHVEGGWVGYAQEFGFIEARTQKATRAKLTYKGLDVEADIIQLDISDLAVRADNVLFTQGDKELRGEDAYLELASLKGVVRRFGDEGIERVFFNGFTLAAQDQEWDIPPDAFRLSGAEPSIWQVCKRASLYPREKLVLRSAALYVDNQRILRYPPFWVVGFAGYRGTSNTSFLSLNTNGGLAVDFPFFLGVTDSASDAVRLQHGAPNAAVGARRGLSVAFEHSYERRSSDLEGSLVLHGIPRRDWGVSYVHSQRALGNGQASLSIQWPDHQNLFMDLNSYSLTRAGTLSTRASLDHTPSGGGWGYTLGTDFLGRSIPLGRAGTSVRFGTGLSYGASPFATGGAALTHRVSGFLSTPSWRAGTLSVTPSLSELFAWNTDGETQNSLRGELSLRQPLGSGSSVALRYTAEYASGSSPYLYQKGFNQQLSLNYSSFGSERWSTFLNATHDLTDRDLYAFASLSYRPWPKYRIGVLGSYYDFGAFSFDDLEVSLNRSIGDREIGIAWSKSDNRISLVFGTPWY